MVHVLHGTCHDKIMMRPFHMKENISNENIYGFSKLTDFQQEKVLKAIRGPFCKFMAEHGHLPERNASDSTSFLGY